jgi:hypothetical protein
MTQDASAPVILSIEPAMPAPRDEAQSITVRGEDFRQGLTFEVTGPSGQTQTYKDDSVRGRQATQFTVMLTLATKGEYSFKVTNPDGGMSAPFVVDVQPGGEAEPEGPVISRVTPTDPVHLPEPQVLRVEGENFERGLRVIVTNPIGEEVTDVTVDQVTANSFEVTVLLDQAGNYELVVSNPSGGVSNVWQVTVR